MLARCGFSLTAKANVIASMRQEAKDVAFREEAISD